MYTLHSVLIVLTSQIVVHVYLLLEDPTGQFGQVLTGSAVHLPAFVVLWNFHAINPLIPNLKLVSIS